MREVYNFDKNLKWIRKFYGLSQDQLANHLNLKRNNVASYELGNAKPSIMRAIKISRFFKFPLETMALSDFEANPPKIKRENLLDAPLQRAFNKEDSNLRTWQKHHDLLVAMVTAYEAMFSMDAEDDLNFVFSHVESLRIIRLLRKDKEIINDMLQYIDLRN